MKEVRFETLKNDIIMKKIYLHPEMEILEMESQELLAGSLPLSDVEVNSEEVLAPEFGEDFIVFDE